MRILLIVLFSITLTGFTQTTNTQVSVKERVFGKYSSDSSDLQGIEFVFPDKIYNAHLDSVTGYLTVQLRGITSNGKYLKNSGKIIQYDTRGKELLWTKPIDYLNTHLLQIDNTIIYSSGFVSQCLGIKTGTERWKTKSYIFLINSTKNIGIGYKKAELIEGIDLKTGSSKWSKYLNSGLMWDDLTFIDDSTLILRNEGLHYINLNNGLGWDYDAMTSIYKSSYLKPSGLYSKLYSNISIDSNCIYFASMDYLVKLNKASGTIIWQKKLPDDYGSNSSIVLKNGKVFLINKGLAYFESDEAQFGKPFFSAFDQATGKGIFMSNIDVTEEYVVHYKNVDDEFYLLFPNRMVKFSKDGEKLADKLFPLEKYGVLKFFIKDDWYIKKSDNSFQTLKESDSTKVYVYTREENTFAIDGELKFCNRFKKTDVFVTQVNLNNHKIITNGKKSVIISQEGKTIAETEAIIDPFIEGNVLYGYINSSFVAIDLSKIFEGSYSLEK